MSLSELIDLRIRESPTYAPPFSFRLNLPYSDPLLKPNPDGRRHSVTALLQKPLAGPASIVQNGPARSQITIRDAELKRAEIGRIRLRHAQVGQPRCDLFLGDLVLRTDSNCLAEAGARVA